MIYTSCRIAESLCVWDEYCLQDQVQATEQTGPGEDAQPKDEVPKDLPALEPLGPAELHQLAGSSLVCSQWSRCSIAERDQLTGN